MIDFIGRIVTVMGVKELSRKEGRGKIEKKRSFIKIRMQKVDRNVGWLVEFILSIYSNFYPRFTGELRAQKWRGQEKELKQEVCTFCDICFLSSNILSLQVGVII